MSGPGSASNDVLISYRREARGPWAMALFHYLEGYARRSCAESTSWEAAWSAH
jgi:hypothetical protein